MDAKDPRWDRAADLVRELSACRDMQQRIRLVAGGSGDGQLWRVAHLLTLSVADACPVGVRDERGLPDLSRLVPKPSGLLWMRARSALEDMRRWSLPPAGGTRAVARLLKRGEQARGFLSDAFATLALDPYSDIGEELLRRRFFVRRDDWALIRSTVGLCLNALDAITDLPTD